VLTADVLNDVLFVGHDGQQPVPGGALVLVVGLPDRGFGGSLG
jgi:hypothetical protein